MTNKSHLINFCYLPYLHLNFSTDTIVFSHAFSRLKTLSFFDFSTTLIVYLFYITSHHHLPSLRKNRIRSKKAPNNTEKCFLFVTFADIITKNMNTSKKIMVQSTEISVLIGKNDNDYISLTDMIKAKDGDFFISDWLRNRNTLEYIGTWEMMYNPNFNYGEFATIKEKAGLNNFKVSVKELVMRTNAICLTAKTGRYGGTYAHKDIAFHFGMWISPTFQLYIVKEYQRLKEQESNPLSLEWNAKRILSKTNYTLHTDAIKNVIIPKMDIKDIKQGIIYATEADMLNIILFGCKAKEWAQANPNLASKGINLRETASINQLVVLSNMESANSEMIKQGVSRKQRFEILHKMAKEQLKVLDTNNIEQKFRKILPDGTKKIE